MLSEPITTRRRSSHQAKTQWRLGRRTGTCHHRKYTPYGSKWRVRRRNSYFCSTTRGVSENKHTWITQLYGMLLHSDHLGIQNLYRFSLIIFSFTFWAPRRSKLIFENVEVGNYTQYDVKQHYNQPHLNNIKTIQQWE